MIVLVMTPVALLYAIPLPALSDEEEILLLKFVQSDEVSTPRLVAELLGRLKVI